MTAPGTLHPRCEVEDFQEHRCERCNGCGRVAGAGSAERPWNAFGDIPPHMALERIMGMHRSRACPDCGGSGVAATRPAQPLAAMQRMTA